MSAADDIDEPLWLRIAREDIGLEEIPGKATAPKIRQWLIGLNAWWTDDEAPWCGVAVAHWMQAAGEDLPVHWYRARAWLEWGSPLVKPLVGCVVVYRRDAGGHVGLVVGQDRRYRLMTLGGNQGNRVSIAPFAVDRVLGYRWPKGHMFYNQPLPLIQSAAASSTGEI